MNHEFGGGMQSSFYFVIYNPCIHPATGADLLAGSGSDSSIFYATVGLAVTVAALIAVTVVIIVITMRRRKKQSVNQRMRRQNTATLQEEKEEKAPIIEDIPDYASAAIIEQHLQTLSKPPNPPPPRIQMQHNKAYCRDIMESNVCAPSSVPEEEIKTSEVEVVNVLIHVPLEETDELVSILECRSIDLDEELFVPEPHVQQTMDILVESEARTNYTAPKNTDVPLDTEQHASNPPSVVSGTISTITEKVQSCGSGATTATSEGGDYKELPSIWNSSPAPNMKPNIQSAVAPDDYEEINSPYDRFPIAAPEHPQISITVMSNKADVTVVHSTQARLPVEGQSTTNSAPDDYEEINSPYDRFPIASPEHPQISITVMSNKADVTVVHSRQARLPVEGQSTTNSAPDDYEEINSPYDRFPIAAPEHPQISCTVMSNKADVTVVHSTQARLPVEGQSTTNSAPDDYEEINSPYDRFPIASPEHPQISITVMSNKADVTVVHSRQARLPVEGQSTTNSALDDYEEINSPYDRFAIAAPQHPQISITVMSNKADVTVVHSRQARLPVEGQSTTNSALDDYEEISSPYDRFPIAAPDARLHTQNMSPHDTWSSSDTAANGMTLNNSDQHHSDSEYEELVTSVYDTFPGP